MDTDRGTAADPLDVEVAFLTPAVRNDLLERWNEPQRRYNNETHLRAVLRAIDPLGDEGESFDGTAERLAAWFHCAVFDPTESENNDKSAVFTERTLDPAAPVEEVARQVRLMGGHRAGAGDPHGCGVSYGVLAVHGAGLGSTYVAEVDV